MKKLMDVILAILAVSLTILVVDIVIVLTWAFFKVMFGG